MMCHACHAPPSQIKREVNKRYRYLELDMDGVFKCMLLLKKKKYAAVKLEAGPNGSFQEEIEQKGLDMVRRDWCPLSKVRDGSPLAAVTAVAMYILYTTRYLSHCPL